MAPDEYVAAGGTPSTLLGDNSFHVSRFYQAQYVDAVRKIAADRGKSREAVFEWLAGKTRQATADRKRLPSPYRRLRKKAAFRDAFYDIPDRVRRDPKAFLPAPLSMSEIILAAMGLMKNQP